MPNDNTALVEARDRLQAALDERLKAITKTVRRRSFTAAEEAAEFADEMETAGIGGVLAKDIQAVLQALAAHTPAEYPDELVNRLCGELDISPAAARRSLANLEARGLIEPASPVQAGLGDWVMVPRSLVYEAWSGLHAFANDATVDTQARLTKALTAPPAPDLQAQLAEAKADARAYAEVAKSQREWKEEAEAECGRLRDVLQRAGISA